MVYKIKIFIFRYQCPEFHKSPPPSFFSFVLYLEMGKGTFTLQKPSYKMLISTTFLALS